VHALENGRAIPRFFFHGLAGTGKTFLWQIICYYFRSNGKIILYVVSTGIAALLLPGGLTAHSAFRIPIDIKNGNFCSLLANSMRADLLREVFLIIWNKIVMQHKFCF
jgi:PIF1-like helicase